MKRFLIVVLPLGVFGLYVMQLHATQEPKSKQSAKTDLNTFMQLKLDHAKGILAGLATEDFEQIAKESQALTALSLQSSWNTKTTVEYLDHSSDFRRALSVITKAAHEENLDRAALAYVNMTVQCIECHRYLRHRQDEDAVPK